MQDQDLWEATEEEILSGCYLKECDQVVRNNPPKFEDKNTNRIDTTAIIGEKTFYTNVADCHKIRLSKGLDIVKHPSAIGRRISAAKQKWLKFNETPVWRWASMEETQKQNYFKKYDDMDLYFYLIQKKKKKMLFWWNWYTRQF